MDPSTPQHLFWGMGGGVAMTAAMSAIDIACWDIKGKKLGVPVYKLIGSKCNKSLRAHASQLQFGWTSASKLSDTMTMNFDTQAHYDVVKEAVSEGYDASAKPCPRSEVFGLQGRHQYGSMRKADIKLGVERIAAALRR